MKKKLKIGLLLDNLNINQLNQEIISDLIEKNICEKLIVIKQNIPKKNLVFYFKKYSVIRILEKILIKLIFIFEKYILSNFFMTKYIFKSLKIQKFYDEIIDVYPQISKSGYFYEFLKQDVQKVKNFNFDVIVRMGSGIIKGEMLNASKNGIFSFHHGDNEYFRGGPPGFWEVFYEKPLTGFIVQKLNQILDGGEILFKGHVETKRNYYQNQISVYKNSAKYLSKVLEDLRNNKIKNIKNESNNAKVYKDPKFLEIVIYLFKTYLKLGKKFFFEFLLNKKIRWHVSYRSNVNMKNLKLKEFKVIQNLNKNRFLADPFIIQRNKRNFIFLEDFYFSKNKGVISCYEILNENEKFLGTVLEENFHLSFPYLFNYKNQIFMCPETHQKEEIRIYICEKFPYKWKFYKTLIKNINAVDTILFEKDNIWWMFTSTSNKSIKDFNELNIFYSENGPLTDNWHTHSLNPVVVNPNIARNGGVVFDKEKIFRISQKNRSNIYGESFSINEIKILDKKNFKEEIIQNVFPKFKNRLKGTHHLNNYGNFFVNDFCL